MSNRRKRKNDDREPFAPPFTSSLDARVPAENIVISHYMAESAKWYVASQASDGAIFTAFAATEPLGRRAAGLRTLAHLKARADGSPSSLTVAEIEGARAELAAELQNLIAAIGGFNGYFPDTYPKEVLLIELNAARKLVRANAEPSLLARWVVPPLVFVSGACAEGIIGAYAQKALEAVTKLLAG